MIITCASCLTKFNLDDARIPAKGAKVRCSRCQHVFFIVPPPETKEEIIEDFESFAKYHEELMGEQQKEEKFPSPPLEEKKRKEIEEEEETFLFSERGPEEKGEEAVPKESTEEGKTEVKALRPARMAQRERRGPSLFFALLFVLVLLVFGIFYLWTELGSGGKLSSYLDDPLKKITDLWDQIWGTEKEGLMVGGLNGYGEKIGEISLYIIEGKVNNQSRSTKKHIKVRVTIFDQNRVKVAEKETICGRILGLGELKNLPNAFFNGEMEIKPQTEKEMLVPSGKAMPFMVVFKDLSTQAKEFRVEIVEAPNL